MQIFEMCRRALTEGCSVVLVPGGQAEIFSTKSWGTEVTVFRAHKGFVRLALRHRRRLVPVLFLRPPRGSFFLHFRWRSRLVETECAR